MRPTHTQRELESARTVQQILVPAENPAIPGFAIEAVYKPFGEVGGDFFQIVSTANGGALIVRGDVRKPIHIKTNFPTGKAPAFLSGPTRNQPHAYRSGGCPDLRCDLG